MSSFDIESILESIGIVPVINAGGPKSKFGGRPIKKSVRAAIAEMYDIAVDVEELNQAVGREVANITGSQAALITNGAAGATILAANSLLCVANEISPFEGKPSQAPQKDEIVVLHNHRGQYTYLLEQAGACIAQVGYSNRIESRHLEAATTERCCGFMFLVGPGVSPLGPTLVEIIEFAHDRNFPVFVSAAATLPPQKNLRAFIDKGADIVAMSGGKHLGSTQTSGLLFGRADLISVAQQITSPNHGSGRALKLSKEDIIGTLVALREYINEDESVVFCREIESLSVFSRVINSRTNAQATVKQDSYRYFFPSIEVSFGDNRQIAAIVYKRLLQGNTRVFVRYFEDIGTLSLERTCTTPNKFEIAVNKLVQIIQEEVTS